MEKPNKKSLLPFLAFVAVIVTVVIISEFFPMEKLLDNLFVNIVLFVIVGAAVLVGVGVVIWVAIMIPFEIIMDIRQKRKIRNAKLSACDIIDACGTVQLKERIDYHWLERLKNRNEINEIMEVLWKTREDREARHLLYDLSQLERELEQLSDEQREEKSI